MEIVNGQQIPEELSLSELTRMMESFDMKNFSLACEALRGAATHDAYQVLKRYIDSSDLYRRRYVLSVIFDYPYASELTPHLIKALHGSEHFLVTTALRVLANDKIHLEDEHILRCLEENSAWLDSCDYLLLNKLEKTTAHTARIVALFRTAPTDGVRIAIAEALVSFAVTENYRELFDLFCHHPASKIRMAACRIADRFERRDLLQTFSKDPDGHIRKFII